MAKITVIDYDRQTQFNDVDVETINRAWGNKPYVLVYKDDVFAGIAQPKGNKTLADWEAYFQNMFDEQEQAEEKAKAEKSQLDRIENGTTQLLAEIKAEAVDEYTLELMENGLL